MEPKGFMVSLKEPFVALFLFFVGVLNGATFSFTLKIKGSRKPQKNSAIK